MMRDPSRPLSRPTVLVALLIVLTVAAGIRLVNYHQVSDGPLLRLHHWAQSDMHFYNSWARRIAAGDLLTDGEMRPYHSWHRRVAREIHDATGVSGPFDESAGRKIWNGWLGEKRFCEDPLYPYFLAALYALFGYDVSTAVLAQTLLGVGSVALVFCLAVVLFDVPVALLAGLVAALFGPLIMYEGVLLRCVMLTFVGLATLCVTILATRRPERSRWFLLVGGMFGVGFMLKSSTILFSAPATVLAGVQLRHHRPRLLGSMGMTALGFAMAVSPLIARNVAVGVPPLGFASSGAITFINHNAEDYVPETGNHLSFHGAAIMQRTGGSWGSVILETWKTHPGPASWLQLVWRKFLAFWHWYEVPNNTNYYYFRLHASAVSALGVDYYLIAPMAAVGLLLRVRRCCAHALAGLYIASGIAGILLFFGLARFRVPIACAMMPFAAFGVVSVIRFVWARRFLGAAAALAAGAVLTATVLRPLPTATGDLLRTADFGVANEITGHYVRQRADEGRTVEALRMLQGQLETEPRDLRAVEPGPTESRISRLSASVAGSFADLHEIAATLNARLERFHSAARHSRRAQVLEVIASRFERLG